MRQRPDFSIEKGLHATGIARVAGVDEAGRGSLAGPVYAAAVVLRIDCIPEGLDDSKRLTASRREWFHEQICKTADVSVASVASREVDRLNVLEASMVAMKRAIEGLCGRPCQVLIDGNRLPQGLEVPAVALVKGDARSLSIAAASIVAKVERDRHMTELAREHPQFGWERNAGYGTREHREALLAHGPTSLHRMSFAPVIEARQLLESGARVLPGTR